MPERANIETHFAEAPKESEPSTSVAEEIHMTRWKDGQVNVKQERGLSSTFGSLPEALAYIRGLCAPRPE